MNPRPVVKPRIVTAIASALLGVTISHAGVTLMGDTNPTNVGSINSSTNLILGQNSTGSILVNGGSSISTANGFLGYNNGANGQATITGAGSGWYNDMSIRIAREENSTGALTVSDGATLTSLNIFLDNDINSTASLTLSGDSTVINSNALHLGQYGNGTFRVLNGAEATTLTLASAGLMPDATYTIEVTGADSQWTTGEIRLGDSGSGSLLVSQGGYVFSTKADIMGLQQTATTDITIDGIGSQWRVVNDFKTTAGQTNIDITAGGSLITGNAHFAFERENPTTVLVSGPGSSWFSSGMIQNDHGTVRIEDGASVTCDVYDVSHNSTFVSSVITGPGSVLEALTHLGVGSSKNAHLLLEDGAQMASGSATIGGSNGQTSAITITGDSTTWTSFGPIVVGFESGDSTLNIDDGARLEALANITVAQFFDSEGTISINGGTLDMNAGNVVFGAGTHGFIFLDGRLENVRHFGSNLVQQGGTLQIGDAGATGETHIEASYQLGVNGRVELDLAGPTLENFDLLTLDQPATLAGSLQLSLLDDYVPEYLEPHRVVTNLHEITGIFNSVDGVEVTLTKYLAVTYDESNVYVTAALPGDTNLDGDVNFSDLLSVAQNYGNDGVSWVNGDFNGSGHIDFPDLLLAAQNYGMSVISGDALHLDANLHARFQGDWQMALNSVPEPGAMSLLLVASLVLRRRAR